MNRTKRLLFSMLTLLCCCTGVWAQSASDMLSGIFTINASGTTVQFSKGNLQYVNGNWQFAEHQYDYIGNNQSDSNKDLFAFNGYSTPDASWFNMSHDQWKYLLATRSVTNSLYAGARYTMATIGGTYKGLIIFPDNYTHPDGTDFEAGTYNSSSNFTATVSLADWALMEAAGCVFLPAAGFYSAPREVFDGFGEAVEINTTTSYNSDNYYTPTFKKDQANCDATSNKNSWMSVRLVRFKTNLQQDTDGYYLIGTVQDWKDFAALVEIIPKANAKMTADIDLGNDQTHISGTWKGESSPEHYGGIFDGQGHTLTVNYNDDKYFKAPFGHCYGATIKNLHVAGYIMARGDHPHTAGVMCNSTGNDVVQNVWVSATIDTTRDAAGAIIGLNNSGASTIRDCLFTGTVKTVNSGGLDGCFLGRIQNGSSNIINCLSTGTFDYYNSSGSFDGTHTNCYVKQFDGEIPTGMQLTDAQLTDGTIAYKLQAGRTDMVWGQRIGTDPEPLQTNNESYRVYRRKNGGYTNDPTLAYEGLQQDADDNYYLIGSLFDWQEFADLVKTTPTANAKMTADINLGDDQTMIGSESTPYQGLFDGQGHTLTVAYSVTSSSSQHVAPFIKIKNATIQNLHVSGSITTAGMRPASITSYVSGTCYVRNCWSDVAITSSYNADICAGGLVTRIDTDQTLHMDDCKFSGSITLSNNSGYRAGGLIGWTQNNGIAKVTNCLFAPSALSTIKSSDDNKMLVSGYQGKVTITNCYYNEVGASASPSWVVQGTAATNAELADGSIAYKLQIGRADLVWGQRIDTDNMPLLTNVESYRVYRILNGGYTNDPTQGYAGLQQDADGNYLIGTVWDWQDFATLVNGGSTNIDAKMTADIDLGDDQTMVGTNSAPYRGIFDGQGHTLTINWTTTGGYCAPFPYINGATFKNLHVTGTINTSHRFTGCLVGKSIGTSYINNCRSSVEMISSYNGDAVRGGFAASVEGGSLNFNDCIFDGTFTGPSSETWGGFVGWKYSYTVNIENGLFVPKSVNVSATYSATFSGNGGKVNNSYYTVRISNSDQGTLVSAEQLADGSIAYKLQAGRADLVWGQRIGTDDMPVLTNDESYRVYRSQNGGYTNDSTQGYAGLQQDTDGNYLIGTVWDWQDFAAIVNSGENTAANARMTDDIDLGDDQTYISPTWHGEFSSQHYHGTFDGQGHTLTVHYDSSNMFHTPFSQTSGATIKNLHVAGTIKSTSSEPSHMSGLVSNSAGSDVIQNVWVSADITGGSNAWIECGAFVGCNNCGNTTITDCLFTGSITTTGGNNGCFAGYNQGYQNSTITTNNCLSTGSFNFTSGTVSRGTINNSYVKSYPNSIPAGMQVTDAQLTDGTTTTALNNDRTGDDAPWVQQGNQPMLAIFANAVTLTDVNDLTALSAYAGKTCKVTYSRSFTEAKSSTVCLPFAFAKGSVGTFYTFTGITKSGSEYIATMTEYPGDNLVANTPYLFTPSTTGDVDFSGTYTLPASITAGSTTSGDWTYLGTYETISWTEAPTGIYGFSAQAVGDIQQGEFVKVGAYVRIKPMRCYLKYKNGLANYAGARGMTRAADEELPETIKVRLISADGEVTAIGSLQTKTGEVTFDKDAWYSLDGRRIEGKPSKSGLYINNGHKVIIK